MLPALSSEDILEYDKDFGSASCFIDLKASSKINSFANRWVLDL
jgi:hypothetical protein